MSAANNFHNTSAGDGFGLSAAQESRADTNEELSFGRAHVFYSEANADLCTVAVLLEVDPVALVRDNTSVLTYLRAAPKGSPSVVVALNFTDTPANVSLNLSAQGINSPTAKTLLTDDDSRKGDQNLSNITLAPYACWIGEVK